MNTGADKKIWEDFRSGENYALSHIYFQNVQILFRYGRKFSSNEEIIKDTIQDLFFDLIRYRDKLGRTDNIKYYLIKSFRRKLIKNLNNEGLQTLGSEEVTEADIVFSFEHEMIEKEEMSKRNEMLAQSLESLSKKQREILFYRYTCNFDYDHICEIMSLKYDSARKQVFRALKALKVALSDNGSFILLSLFSSK